MPIARPPQREDDYRELAQRCVQIARMESDEKLRVSLHNMVMQVSLSVPPR
jgi:hypothetical protein